MNVRSIMKKWLQDHRYDGLYLDEGNIFKQDDKIFAATCCCFLDDPETWKEPDAGFMACDSINKVSKCKPGYKCDREVYGHKYKSIGPKKEKGQMEMFGGEK